MVTGRRSEHEILFRMIQTRNARNMIRRLVTVQGEVLPSQKDIKREAVHHFQTLCKAMIPLV